MSVQHRDTAFPAAPAAAADPEQALLLRGERPNTIRAARARRGGANVRAISSKAAVPTRCRRRRVEARLAVRVVRAVADRPQRLGSWRRNGRAAALGAASPTRASGSHRGIHRDRRGSTARRGALAGGPSRCPRRASSIRLAELLRARGRRTLRCPLVAILDAPDPGPVEAWLRALGAGAFDDVVLLTR